MDWYKITNENIADSPSLLIYKERVQQNIALMIQIAGNADRLYTHVKTNKMVEVVEMMIQAGIYKFKCATIAEAELVAIAINKANISSKYEIVVAHQLVGPKIDRLIQLIETYPTVSFASLIDCLEMAKQTNEIYEKHNIVGNSYIDINNGMNRSGHLPDNEAVRLYESINQLPNLSCLGLHVYDGHLREPNFDERRKQIDTDFNDVNVLIEKLIERGNNRPRIIAGGTPAFTSHALRESTFCSPGTCVLWDWGYGDKFEEQKFLYAAVVLSRVISKPSNGIITLDMGHKAVASENPIDKRIRFLNLENANLLSQSEEHGVVSVENWDSIKVGDVIYGVPYHVCPTVNLYDEAYCIENNQIITNWQVLGRKRKINI